ncbi:hypothetical protein ACFP3Q_14370 [Nocardioides sp. GCM10027113]|uniref:hypothetical protein n=1 Tax=unclassified Nocardioides TaxID=2615069 RepID=UPI00361B872C
MSDEEARRCADQLRDLARDPRFDSRAEDLNALAADIASPEGDSWADVDLFAAFPANSTAHLRHRNVVERLLGVLAGVSVFLPVGWTWLSFHRASDAYEQMIRAGEEPEGRTFLSLWTTGFEGRLTGDHQLVPMGMWSVLLIAFAILSLVAHRLVAGYNVRSEEQAARDAQRELVAVLTSAQVILSARRANHPLRVEGIIKSSMKKLREAHEAARRVIVELTETSTAVSSSVGELVESAKRAGEDTQRLIASAAELQTQLNTTAERHQTAVTTSLQTVETAVTSSMAAVEQRVTATMSQVDQNVTSATSQLEQKVTTAAAQLEQNVTSTVRAAQNSADDAAKQLRDGLRESLSELESAMGVRFAEFRDDAVEGIRRAGDSLHGAVDGIGASAARNAEAATSLSQQIAAMTDDNATTRAEFIAAIADIRAAVDGIESALLRHEGALQGQASELSGARDAAERMLRRLTLASDTDGVVTGA